MREMEEKGVVGKDKQQRGEGASLLNTSLDVDPDPCLITEKGSNLNIRKNTMDKINEPGREP